MVEVTGSDAMLSLNFYFLLLKCLMKRLGTSALGQYLRWIYDDIFESALTI